MTLQEIRDALKDRNLRAVAVATDIHHNTLIAIRKGAISNPHQKTLDTLAAYLRPAS